MVDVPEPSDCVPNKEVKRKFPSKEIRLNVKIGVGVRGFAFEFVKWYRSSYRILNPERDSMPDLIMKSVYWNVSIRGYTDMMFFN